MNEFAQLVDVMEALLGPEGCPWDREQTLASTKKALLEEAYEAFDAIVAEDDELLKEELGDIFYTALFLTRLAEKEERCTIAEVLQGVIDKLVRRHPHVFGEGSALTDGDAVEEQWERLKKEEKSQHPLANLPKSMPALMRATRYVKKSEMALEAFEEIEEEELAEQLFHLSCRARKSLIDPEIILQEHVNRELERVLKP